MFWIINYILRRILLQYFLKGFLLCNRLHRSRCQVDASWTINQTTFGGAFIMELEDETLISGSFGGNQVLSPLHAEVKSLLWAMRVSLQMRHSFESDCLQLVKLIDEEEVLPSLASELEEFYYIRSLFNLFSLYFIPREFSVRADTLAKGVRKGARAKATEFSHVDSLVSPGLALPNPFEPI